MLSERTVYLAKKDNDKGNGFYERRPATPVGSKENKADWMRVFDDLITRGLKLNSCKR